MKISKTLFKNFTRCDNFLPLFDMYINRGYHNVKNVNSNALIEELKKLPNNFIDESIDDATLILSHMFDINTGEDLLDVKSTQLEAFEDIFVDVEELAINQARRIFSADIISSRNTKKQKYFEYKENDNTYYCYLDGYLELQDSAHIFEVKATTSKKFDEIKLKIKKEEFPLFIKSKKGIYEFVGKDYIGLEIDGKIISKEDVDNKIKKFLDRFSDVGKYVFDLSVERFIIENAKPDLSAHYYLIVLNHEYTYDGISPEYKTDKSGHDLFKIYDMTFFSKLYQEEIIKLKNHLERVMYNLEYHDNLFSKGCEYKKTTQCKFFNVCSMNASCDGSIFEYTNKSYAFKDPKTKEKLSLYDMLNRKYYTMASSRDYISKINNIYELNCYLDNTEYLNKDAIKFALSKIKYPVYYLDFESYNCPLPRFNGEHPYTQSLFQYSLHTEKIEGECDIEKNHHQYLATDHLDRRVELIESLINDIDLSNGGTVIVYNETFEKTRLKELSEIFPKYREKLLNIRDHVFDLCQVLTGIGKMYDGYKQNDNGLPSFMYYNHLLHGSFSIKKVLPIFTNLSYSKLNVKNGVEAILAYGKFDTLTQEEYENIYKSLTIYCRQDTWSMVEIIKGLKNKIKNE